MTGIDLVFQTENKVYIVEIKSGPHWGNSSQISKMILNFEAAKTTLQPLYSNSEIIAVNGCCYGKDANYNKRDGVYWKLCGQDFWQFISGNDRLYLDIIEPLGHQAKQRNDAFETAYARLINTLTRQFATEFCTDEGDIDWQKLTMLVSERKPIADFPKGLT